MARLLVALLVAALATVALGQTSSAADSLDSPPGDTNCDRITDTIDATLTLQFHARLLAELQCRAAADANDDGRIDSLDALYMLQHTAVPFKQLEFEIPPTGVSWEGCVMRGANPSEFSDGVMVFQLLEGDAWDSIWNRALKRCAELGSIPSLPTDLNDDMLVLLLYGFGSMGQRLTIDSIQPHDSRWVINATVSGCPVIPTITDRHMFLRVPRTHQPIRVIKNTLPCT